MLKKIFAPGNDSFCASLGLLVLRLSFGLTMLLAHGLDKAKGFSKLSSGFPDPLHVGRPVSLSLSILAELVCSGLLAVGLVTRFAALVCCINIAVAFFIVLKGAFGESHNGELAFLYLAGYFALLIAGPGKLSMDKAVFGGSGKAGSAESSKR